MLELLHDISHNVGEIRKDENPNNTKQKRRGVRWCSSMDPPLERTTIDVYMGIEHRKREQQAEDGRQLQIKGWRVAAAEAVMTAHEGGEAEVEQGWTTAVKRQIKGTVDVRRRFRRAEPRYCKSSAKWRHPKRRHEAQDHGSISEREMTTMM